VEDPLRRTTPTFWLLLIGSLAVGLVASPNPAAAHGDEGTMEVLVAEAQSPTEIYVEVGLLYANDDDLATEATVTVTATGPEGRTVGPLDVPVLEDARYATTVTVPGAGDWALAVSSTGPTASATATVEVTPESGTTATVLGTTDGSPTTASPATTGAGTTGTGPDTADSPETSSPDGPGGSTTTLVERDEDEGTGTGAGSAGLVVLAIVMVIIAGGAFYVLRGRSRGPA